MLEIQRDWNKVEKGREWNFEKKPTWNFFESGISLGFFLFIRYSYCHEHHMSAVMNVMTDDHLIFLVLK